MRAKLRRHAGLFAVAMVVAIGTETAKADQTTTLQGIQVSWDGQGEIQLAPDDDGDFSLSLRLYGNVVVRGRQFDARADRLIYDTEEKSVSLESGDSSEVRLSFRMPDDGPTLRLAARKIVISLSDGRIKVEGAGILSTPSKKPP